MAWTAFGGIGSSTAFDNVRVFDADVAFELDSANHKFSNCFVSGAITDKGISDIADPGDGRGTGGIQVINCDFGATILQFNVPRTVQIRNTICGQVIAAGGQDYDIEVVLQPFSGTDYPIDLTAVKGLNLTLLGAHGSSPLDHRVAVHLDTVTHFSLNGSVLWANDHGVFLESCAYGEDNLLVQGASISSNGGFQGKRLTTCNNVKVAGGVKHLGLGNKPNYGVQIDADCTNIEIDCHLEDSGTTGPINNLAAFEVWTHARISTEDPNDNDVLVWDDANQIYRPEAGGGGGGASVLDDLTDVDLTGLADEDILQWDATAGQWVPVPIPSSTDANAIHDNVAAEISVLTQVTPAVGDHLLIEDASDSNNKKRIEIGDLTGVGGSDPDAIHDNVAGEIAAVTEKVTPVDADVVLIEDSAASNAKKRVQLGNLPGGGGGGGSDTGLPAFLDTKGSTDTPDAEFAGSISPYTAVAGSSSTVDLLLAGATVTTIYDLTSRPGWLLIQVGTADLVQFRTDYTLPDNRSMVLAVAGSPMAQAGDNMVIAMRLNDDDGGSTAGNHVTCMLEQDTTEFVVQANSSADSTGTELTLRSFMLAELVLLRIVRDGLTYHCFASGNGWTWTWVDSFTFGAAMSNVWISVTGPSAADRAPIIAIPWIREGSNAHDPW